MSPPRVVANRYSRCPPRGSAPARLGSQPSVPPFPGRPTARNVRPREEKFRRNGRSCRKDPAAWRWPLTGETPGISEKQGEVFLERKRTDRKNRSNTSPETGLWTRDVPWGGHGGGVRTDPQAPHPCAGMVGGVPRGRQGVTGQQALWAFPEPEADAAPPGADRTHLNKQTPALPLTRRAPCHSRYGENPEGLRGWAGGKGMPSLWKRNRGQTDRGLPSPCRGDP